MSSGLREVKRDESWKFYGFNKNVYTETWENDEMNKRKQKLSWSWNKITSDLMEIEDVLIKFEFL